MFENINFQFFFDGVWKFHPGVGEELYAVVVIGIVRRGNHDAGMKIVLANEAGDAGGSDDAGKSDRSARLREACGEERSDVGAGFAGVHPDEDVSGVVFAAQICAEGTAGGAKRGVVERRGAGDAADAVCAEEVFGHERKLAALRIDDLEKA